jgi:dolichol-phosphate mannosyltransferase/undecaprenyl-phosphate 4-deoxy-4-formamido-L-arabinose transferase
MSNIVYSVVIPVYNSTESVAELCERLVHVFEDTVKETFEIVLVDDSSPNPDTWKTLESIHEKDNRVKIIQLMKNFGQQSALLCGFTYTKGEYVITMDDDLQHPPEEILKLIAEKEHDVVMAQFKQRQHAFLKVGSSKIKQWFDYKILGRPKGLHLSSFRVINRSVISHILQIKTAFPFVGTMIFMITNDVKGVEVRHDARTRGTSGYTFWRMLMLFWSLLINNSTLLLNITGIFGLIISFASFITTLFLITKKIVYSIPIVGWTSLMVVVFFLGGISLFSIGIIGQYLIRIIHETQSRPSYAIRKIEGIEE